MHRNRWISSRLAELSRSAVALVVVSVVASGCSTPAEQRDVEPLEPAASPPVRPDLADAALWLSFEKDAVGYDGSREYPDAQGGPFAGRVVDAHGGTVEEVSGFNGAGTGVQFPAKCSAPSGCERAMVEVPPSPALNPGLRDFQYGARVWLARDQTTTGSNIVQKGRFSTTGGLWKLQVDSEEGAPSCVVGWGDDVVVVRSSTSIADSTWHEVTCRRDSHGVTIRVDHTVDQVRGQTGSVDNSMPIRVGSPGVNDSDDQFHGRVDDVFVIIEPAE